MLLDVTDLEVSYGDYQVVWGVSLFVAAGESVALLGPNGSGKSTVVNTISGLLPTTTVDYLAEVLDPGVIGQALTQRSGHKLVFVQKLRQQPADFGRLTLLVDDRLLRKKSPPWHPAGRRWHQALAEVFFQSSPLGSTRRSTLPIASLFPGL